MVGLLVELLGDPVQQRPIHGRIPRGAGDGRVLAVRQQLAVALQKTRQPKPIEPAAGGKPRDARRLQRDPLVVVQALGLRAPVLLLADLGRVGPTGRAVVVGREMRGHDRRDPPRRAVVFQATRQRELRLDLQLRRPTPDPPRVPDRVPRQRKHPQKTRGLARVRSPLGRAPPGRRQVKREHPLGPARRGADLSKIARLARLLQVTRKIPRHAQAHHPPQIRAGPARRTASCRFVHHRSLRHRGRPAVHTRLRTTHAPAARPRRTPRGATTAGRLL